MSVAVIGAGMIGSALIESLLKSQYEGKIIAADVRVERLTELKKLGVATTSDNKEAAKKAEIAIICVKPKDVKKVLKEVKDEVKGKIVISCAAAVRLTTLKKTVPEAHFVRAMPNIAIMVQESMTAYCTDPDTTVEEKAKAREILSRLGRVTEVEEEYMDAITGLSGCAPAYLSIVLEALTYAGLQVGLPREIALLSAAQSMIGTGKLVIEAKKHPAEIRDMVTTPGGVTIEGLRELEKVPIRYVFMRAVKTATAKSRRISKALVKD